MMYFDNAATTLPKPNAVKTAVLQAMDTCGNPARGAHSPALHALRLLADTRERLAAFFGVSGAENVIFTPNATAALNLAIGGVKGHIVTTAAEHNSVLRPVYRHANYTVTPVDAAGRLDAAQLEAAIRPDTEAVVVTHASNVTGNIYPMEAIGQLCERRRLRLIVDAAQTAGLLAVDMMQLKASALCFSGHKSLYAPQGIGALCLSLGFLPAPRYVGGSGFDSFSAQHPLAAPDRLEAGTPNAHGIAGLAAGIAYVQNLGDACFLAADGLARLFIAGVRRMDAYRLYGDVDEPARLPIVALNHRRMDGAELACRLDQTYGIAVRAGAHCAPLMHRALGTEKTGAVRFSFSHLNTEAEVETALEALKALA